MSILTLVIGGVLLLAIIGVSVYGARVLPADAQLPLHLGPGGYTNWQSRNVGLLMWPLIAAAVWVIIAVSGGGHRTGSGHSLPLPIALTVALGVMLVSHVGAIRAGLSRSGHG
jgi:hypothetical protein